MPIKLRFLPSFACVCRVSVDVAFPVTKLEAFHYNHFIELRIICVDASPTWVSKICNMRFTWIMRSNITTLNPVLVIRISNWNPQITCHKCLSTIRSNDSSSLSKRDKSSTLCYSIVMCLLPCLPSRS